MVLLFHFMWKEEKLDFLMVSLHKTQIKKKKKKVLLILQRE